MYYTDDEINDTIQHMGYELPQFEELERIKSGLLEFKDEEDIDELLREPLEHDLWQLYNHFDGDHLVADDNDKRSQHYVELLQDAYKQSEKLWGEIVEIDNEIQDELASLPEETRLYFENAFNQSQMEQQPSPPSSLASGKTAKKITFSAKQKGQEKENTPPRLPMFEFDENNEPILMDQDVEQRIIGEVLKQRGCVRVGCPKPGRAPFKHDPVARNQQYQQMWNRFPTPAEKKRKNLRWRIRALMMRKDMPVLKLVPNPGLKPRLPWID